MNKNDLSKALEANSPYKKLQINQPIVNKRFFTDSNQTESNQMAQPTSTETATELTDTKETEPPKANKTTKKANTKRLDLYTTAEVYDTIQALSLKYKTNKTDIINQLLIYGINSISTEIRTQALNEYYKIISNINESKKLFN